MGAENSGPNGQRKESGFNEQLRRPFVAKGKKETVKSLRHAVSESGIGKANRKALPPGGIRSAREIVVSPALSDWAY